MKCQQPNSTVTDLLWLTPSLATVGWLKIMHFKILRKKSRIQQTKHSRPMQIVAPIPKKILLVRQNLPKNIYISHGNFTPFMSKSFYIWDQFFSLLFLEDSKNLKRSLSIYFVPSQCKTPWHRSGAFEGIHCMIHCIHCTQHTKLHIKSYSVLLVREPPHANLKNLTILKCKTSRELQNAALRTSHRLSNVSNCSFQKYWESNFWQ